MNAIFQILNPSNTLTINRPLAHAIGLAEATVYAALISKCSYYERIEKLDDGWFYSTVPDLEESTALSEYQQKRCIKRLIDIGLIESKNRGMPAKRSFRIIANIELLNKLISDGNSKCGSIKPNAAMSYEKKRKVDEKTYNAPSPPCSEETAEQETDGNEPDSSPCSEETAEQEPEKLQSLLQRNCGTCSEETSDQLLLYKSKDNKSLVINQSINQSKDDGIDRIDEQRKKSFLEERSDYLELIKENIEYDYLIEAQEGSNVDRVDEIVNIMLDVVCSQSEYIRVNGESCPKEVVKSRFLKLNSNHIEYVMLAMDRCASDIRNIRSYLITALYNAPITIDSFYTAMVKYDFRAG